MSPMRGFAERSTQPFENMINNWPRFKVFWFSKDRPTGHSKREKKKRQTEEEVGRQYQRADRNGLCQLN